MRTKIFNFVLLVASILTLGSCGDKSTEGLTRITYFPVITLQGESEMVIGKGSSYTDPGYVCTLNGEDLSSQVTVNGTVNTSKSGKYNLSYITPNNADGFGASASRTVFVFDLNNPVEGFYGITPSSFREYGGKTVAFGKETRIYVLDNGDGTYFVSCLLGGWYEQRANYGERYAMTGNIAIAADGTISLVDSYIAGFGDSLVGLSGNYDKATGKMTINCEYVSGMKFNMTWIKK